METVILFGVFAPSRSVFMAVCKIINQLILFVKTQIFDSSFLADIYELIS